MKKLLKQFVLIGLCILAALSLAACKDIDRDSTIQKKGDFVPQFYTIGDVEGITAERKCEIDVGYNESPLIVFDSIVLKNNGETEKTVVVTYPNMIMTDHSDPERMKADGAEPFVLYGGTGSLKMWDKYEGTYATKLTNKEYLQDLDSPLEDVSMNETMTVYEFAVPQGADKSVEMNIRFEYDEMKTRPFLFGWDLRVNENGANSSIEATAAVHTKVPEEAMQNYCAVVIAGEDIGADAFEVTAVDENTREPAEIEIIESVMTVEEMLLKSLETSGWYLGKCQSQFGFYYEVDERTRQSMNDTLFKAFDYFRENGIPVIMLTIDSKEQAYVKASEGLQVYRVESDEHGWIEKPEEEYKPRLEYRKLYDLSLMINELCFEDEFYAAEIAIPSGEERTVNMKYMKQLDYDETDNRSARLNILPAPPEDVEMTSSYMTLKLTDKYALNSQNLGLKESDGVYTASFDPYREGYTIALTNR